MHHQCICRDDTKRGCVVKILISESECAEANTRARLLRSLCTIPTAFDLFSREDIKRVLWQKINSRQESLRRRERR